MIESTLNKEERIIPEDIDLAGWPERILLVDDDDGILQLLSRHMESFGLQADAASNGREAVALLQERQYGVVITDMMMPEMDGMALLNHINHHHSQVDVIVVSGYSRIYSFTDVINAGATDFIAKPYEQDELKAKMQRICRERRLIADLHAEIRAHERESLRRHEEQEKLRTITATANDAIVMMDDQGLVTFWNEAAQRIFGYSMAEALGQDLHKLIVPDRYQDIYQGSLDRFRTSGVGPSLGTTMELAGLRKDGQEFPVELSLAAVRLMGRWHAVGLLRDITQRKIAEAELLKAKGDAEVASRIKSDFMNTISHELRTPMNGIIGFGALLGSTDLIPKQQKYLSLMLKSADRLMGLITQLLNFSSIEASTKDLNAVSFDLDQFFATIITQFQPKAAKKGVSLDVKIGEDVPRGLHGDHVILQQIVSNILANAVKYTDSGAIVCEAVLQEPPRNGQIQLLVSVADSGCGIAPDKQGVVFDSFTQADEYKTRRYQGAGLGLTVAAKLVDLMGGRIWLESKVDQGTTFFFTVQLRLAAS